MAEVREVHRRSVIVVDSSLYVWADGVKVARLSLRDNDVFLQFFDRHKYRSFDRGTAIIEVAIWDLLQAVRTVDSKQLVVI